MTARRALSIAVLAALAFVARGSGEQADTPMTDEDVVRLFVAGRPASEIIEEIDRREPGFDLSPEMLAELRHVKLPEEVIEAMIRRKKAADARTEALAAAAADTSRPVLTIVLNPGRNADGTKVSMAKRIDPQLAAEWELGNAPEDREFADVALFVACLTPDHVPDQWRLKSPLGRDFAMPRHEIVAFVSGVAGEAEGEADGRRVSLDVPGEIEVPLEPDVPHDLMLGLALQIGGRYRAVARDDWPGLSFGAEGARIAAKVRGRGLRRMKVEFERDRDEDDEAADASPER